jgi:hypothetical protein
MKNCFAKTMNLKRSCEENVNAMTAVAAARSKRVAITEVAMEDLETIGLRKTEIRVKTEMITADPILKIVHQDQRELEPQRIDKTQGDKTTETHATTETAAEISATLKAKGIREIRHQRTNLRAKPISS